MSDIDKAGNDKNQETPFPGHSLTGKSVLVTGGTGSFGQAFATHVLQHCAVKKLIVFSRDELKQHDMQTRLPSTPDRPIRYFIGDVRDPQRLQRAFYDVDVVVHAAALKQVPACEYNPFEAIQTNILGTCNVINAAIDQGVDRVLGLSTDKAVNPVNLYGGTKLCFEKTIVQANAYSTVSRTHFSCTRYGNVAGSRGSVIPLFKKQAESGSVTVTDERMTRFWMTLERGVQFVLQSLDMMSGGEVFVPKMPSMKIIDLAHAIAPGCEVKVTGIRPGEKLHEVLVSAEESRHALEFDDFFVIQPAFAWWRMPQWPDAKPITEGFRYTSDSNDRWLSAAELLEMIH